MVKGCGPDRKFSDGYDLGLVVTRDSDCQFTVERTWVLQPHTVTAGARPLRRTVMVHGPVAARRPGAAGPGTARRLTRVRAGSRGPGGPLVDGPAPGPGGRHY